MAFFDEIAFFPIEPDYFNPWTATRIATVWFERELLRSGGDVDLAIRAYHRGQDSAMDEKGDGYLRRVRRLRESYIRTQRASPSWAFLASRCRSSSRSPFSKKRRAKVEPTTVQPMSTESS